METSKEGLELIKRHEGFRADAYRCPAGVWTIGYGHTGPDVKAGMKVSREQAEALLKKDVQAAEAAVGTELPVLRQNQFDALVSFTYNVGVNNFRHSTLLQMIRVNPLSANIRNEFARWNKAKGSMLPGLVLRRKNEAELYFKS